MRELLLLAMVLTAGGAVGLAPPTARAQAEGAAAAPPLAAAYRS
jgi:hypothetical protein